MYNGTLPDRYHLAVLWVRAIKTTWTKTYIAKALRITGMLPFTRSAHLVGNAPDVEIADCIKEDERIRLRENNRKRRIEVLSDDQLVLLHTTLTHIEHEHAHTLERYADACDDSQASPLTCTEVEAIAAVSDDTDTRGMVQWPNTAAERLCPNAWARDLEQSPIILQKFRQTPDEDLRKIFGVGTLLGTDVRRPAQALILGYCLHDSILTYDRDQLLRRLNDHCNHNNGDPDWNLLCGLMNEIMKVCTTICVPPSPPTPIPLHPHSHSHACHSTGIETKGSSYFYRCFDWSERHRR